MSFRTVVIQSRAKLETRLNYLIIRHDGTETKIFLSEISVLIIQSTAVSLTASLLNELCKNNTKVIFCDEKYNPSSELLPYYGAHNTSKRYKEQFGWSEQTKAIVWQAIIQKKILMQASYLWERGFEEESKMLETYSDNVQEGDTTNREGHAAKVYFNCLLERGVSRREDSFYNSCLNYGYAVLLSEFNREIVASGYLTQIGIWHDNEFNQFNLASDLMEPFRVFVDRIAFTLTEGENFKPYMADVLNTQTESEGKMTTLDVAIRQYIRSVLHALGKNDCSLISFPNIHYE